LGLLGGFFDKKASSKDIAKDRLKLVLIHDRANCTPEVLDMLKVDILNVIANYMEIDEDEMEIQISHTPKNENGEVMPVLYANIPIKSIKKTQKAHQGQNGG
jgi:cell division topological specificity factor